MSALPNAPVRPVAAASLILLRQKTGGPEVLVGRRRRDLRFMPGVFAFPGGKLDPQDRCRSPFPEQRSFLPRNTDRETERWHAAFLRAALRELHEETGLLLGDITASRDVTTQPKDRESVWARYAAAGLAPTFTAMYLVARAITPTASPLRFHNRFFMADGRHAKSETRGSGELEEISWVPVSEARALPMAEVGTLAMTEALAHWESPQREAAALLQWVGRDMTLRIRRRRLTKAAHLNA